MHVLHNVQSIYEALGKAFDLVDVKVRNLQSEGNTLRCIQYEEKVNGTLCSQEKQTKMAVSKIHDTQENQQILNASASIHPMQVLQLQANKVEPSAMN